MLVASATLVVIVTLVIVFPTLRHESEPSYNGRTLSEWLKDYRRPERNGSLPTEAEFAVRAIGTNALPVLLQWNGYELPWWRKTLLALTTWPVEGKTSGEGEIIYGRSLILGESTQRAQLAEVGFIILNTNAAPVIPNLEAMMKNGRSEAVRLRAIYALGEIGRPGIPALTNALADIKQPNRCEIIEAIYGVERMSLFCANDIYRGSSLPALTRARNDPDIWVRKQADSALYNLDPQITRRL